MREKNFVLIDAPSYFYRAFYAIRGLATSKGFPTNAIFGVAAMLNKVLKNLEPEYIAAVFDTAAPTFREKLFEPYKAQRPPMPDALSMQLPYVRKLMAAYGLHLVEKEGYEADDVIATLARKAVEEELKVVVISKDKDLAQVVRDGVVLYDDTKERFLEARDVVEKYGILPESVVDFLALTGDAVDNVPGVSGVGEKTAVKLISEFKHIENLYEKLNTLADKRLQEKLQKGRESAFLSKRLVTVESAVPIEFDLASFQCQTPDVSQLRQLYQELEFQKLLKELPPVKTLSSEKYQTTETRQALDTIIKKIEKTKTIAIALETDVLAPMEAELVGISVCYAEGEVGYIPLQLHRDETIALLKPILEDPTIKKVGQNIKESIIILRRYGIHLQGVVCDTIIADYLLNPGGSHDLATLAQEHLQHSMMNTSAIFGTGDKTVTLDTVRIKTETAYACEVADVTYRLGSLLTAKLKEYGLYELFESIEMPLVSVLVEMEMKGVKVDASSLVQLSAIFSKKIQGLTADIYALANEEFNIDSPQQLSKILFDKLKLSHGRRTKTGYSTDVGVLEQLSIAHPLPAKILEYRTLGKLKNTYVDSLGRLIHPKTGRVHTSYMQTATTTGRLSSRDPNLQNIPVRTEEGRLIRKAFVAGKGWLLLSADYSQIELRVLAHLSEDAMLLKTFAEGGDVHQKTAMEIFGVGAPSVTDEMRRKAKVINFGIIYGMSAHGLSQQLNIAYSLAQECIESYFERYKGVRRYLDSILEGARKDGYVTTLLKRRRTLREIQSQNTAVRSAAERAAINTPIQGTAADLMKLAMIHVQNGLREREYMSAIIMQVHDEIVLEVLQKELETVRSLVRQEMEHVYQLNVPLKVTLKQGENWSEMS